MRHWAGRASTTAKRRIVLALLVVLALWPPVQHALVQRYGLNPWKFFGFAMYAQPRIIPIVDVYVFDEGGRRRPLLRPDEQRAVETFQLRREVWGELEAPDELARVLRRRVAAKADIVLKPFNWGLLICIIPAPKGLHIESVSMWKHAHQDRRPDSPSSWRNSIRGSTTASINSAIVGSVSVLSILFRSFVPRFGSYGLGLGVPSRARFLSIARGCPGMSGISMISMILPSGSRP